MKSTGKTGAEGLCARALFVARKRNTRSEGLGIQVLFSKEKENAGAEGTGVEVGATALWDYTAGTGKIKEIKAN